MQQPYAMVVKDNLGAAFTGVSKISVGQRHTCVIKSGSVWCWGLDREGELGNDESRTDKVFPVLVKKSDGTDLINVDHISNGQFHTCASTTTGEMWCWGGDKYGEAGDGQIVDGRNRAVRVLKSASVPLTGVSEISAGDTYTCARLTGSVWCWGNNNVGQLGDGTKTNRLYPVQVFLSSGTALANAITISSGISHTCAVANNKMLCWGYNNVGQLSDGTLIDKLKAIINGL